MDIIGYRPVPPLGPEPQPSPRDPGIPPRDPGIPPRGPAPRPDPLEPGPVVDPIPRPFVDSLILSGRASRG